MSEAPHPFQFMVDLLRHAAAVADARERPYTSASDISGALRAAAAAAVPPPEAPVVAPPAPYSVTVFHGVTAETITLTR